MLSSSEVRALLARLDGLPADALESETVEFKPWIAAPAARKSQIRTLREAAVALANARGGVLVLGVADRKRSRAEAIEGVGALDTESLRRDIYDGTDPHILADIEAIDEPEGRILVLRIPRGSALHTTTDGVTRLRVGKESKPLTGSGLAAVLFTRNGLDLTAQALPDANLADLDPEQVRRLRRVIKTEGVARELSRLAEEELLRALGLVSNAGITRAAVLLLGTPSALARLTPNNEIIFLRRKAAEAAYDVRRDLKSPLLQQLEEVEALLEAHTGLTTVAVKGLRDLEIPDIDRWSVREAILNAVCHRDWFVNQSTLVSLHADRMEVESPGGFVGGVTPTNVIRHAPVRRNPLLAGIMQTIGLVNRAGLGVDRLHLQALRAGKRPPRYEDAPAYVRLILSTRTDQRFSAFVANEREHDRDLSLNDLLILEALTRSRRLDRWSAAACLQVEGAVAAECLVSLRERGYLISEGRGQGVRYRLAPGLSLSSRRPLPGLSHPDRVWADELLELVADRGSVTNADVRRLTGKSRSRALQLLAKLRAEGLLELTGSRRGARYVAARRSD